MKNYMKIAMVCPHYPPHMGGTEKYVYNLSKIFSQSNNVDVITTKSQNNAPDIEYDDKFTIYRFGYHFNPLNNPFSISQIKFILNNRKRYEIFHFNDIYAFSTFPSLLIKDTPKILTFHTWRIMYKNPLKNNFVKIFEKLCLNKICKNIDSIIVLVDNQKQYLVEMGVDSEKISVIPNGINVNFFGRDKLKAKEYFNIQSEFAVGFFGRFIERKGIASLLEAFKDLSEDLFLFGYGPLKKLIEIYSKKYSNIHLIEGPFAEEEIALIYSALDLFILPSLSGEGCPTTLLEALASGTISLASDLPENISTIRDKGIFFRRGDVKDLRNKIDVAKTTSYSDKELKTYVKDYDWSIVSAKIIDLYHSLI